MPRTVKMVVQKIVGGLLLLLILSACAGWMPGRQAYWDAQVKQMCKADGGVKIFDQIVVSASEAAALPKVGDFFAVTPETLAKDKHPAFSRLTTKAVRERDPSVIRYEQEIVRKSDLRVVAIAISYARGGGDFPVGDHPSTFWCPDPNEIYEGLHRIYRVQGAR
jgi:hypothetical protein